MNDEPQGVPRSSFIVHRSSRASIANDSIWLPPSAFRLLPSSFLSSLPHQIPFRAASAVRRLDERSVEGVFVCTANDASSPTTMAVEAMAQFAGGLVLKERGFLIGIDGCELLRPIAPGDVVVCTVTLDAELGGTYRFSGVGKIDGVEAVQGRFYLASSAHAQT